MVTQSDSDIEKCKYICLHAFIFPKGLIKCNIVSIQKTSTGNTGFTKTMNKVKVVLSWET